VTESVVAIRDHQVEKFGKVEGIGRDRIGKTYKPKTREALDDFCAASNATDSSPSAS
jgi:hypothetical protein